MTSMHKHSYIDGCKLLPNLEQSNAFQQNQNILKTYGYSESITLAPNL